MFKKQIKQLLRSKEYDELFALLNLENEDSFAKILIENECLHDHKFRLKFWKDYFPEHSYFIGIIKGSNASEFIECFVKQYREKDLSILKRISSINPIALLKVIRNTKSFLNNDLLKDMSFWENAENIKLREHYLAFFSLSKEEKRLYSNAMKRLRECSLNYEEWLAMITFHHLWHYRNNIDLQAQFKATFIVDYERLMAYSGLLSAIIVENLTNPEKLRNYQNREGSVLSDLTYVQYNKCCIAIEEWISWYLFVHHKLDNYAHDDNMDVKRYGEEIVFFPVDLKKKSLELEENAKMLMGIDKWHNQHLRRALEILTSQIEKGVIPIPAMKTIWKTVADISVLYDYERTSFLFKLYGIETGDTSEPWNLITSLIPIRLMDTVLSLPMFQNADRTEQESWFDTLKKFFSFEEDAFPILKLNYESWIATSTPRTSNAKKNKISLADQLVYKIDVSTKKLNRFNPHIDLIKRPFHKVGGNVIGPRFIFSSVDLIWTALESHLDGVSSKKGGDTKTETDRQEFVFSEFLDIEGINKVNSVKVIHPNDESHDPVGEIDILLWQENQILIVEVKRSKLRLNHYDGRIEREQLLPKAHGQLRKVIEHLKRYPACLVQYGISKELIESANISGLILTMNTIGDRIRFAKDIYKTSFAAIHGIVKPVRTAEGNRIKALIEQLEAQYEFVEKINPKKELFSFGMKIS